MARDPATRPRYDDLPDMVTPKEMCAFLAIGKNQGYDLLKAGVIRSHRYGRVIRIPKTALLEPLSLDESTKTKAPGKRLTAVAVPGGRRA